MPKDDFYTPTDIDALRMENELLTFEVRFLKAEFAEPERSRAQLQQARDQLEEARTQLELRLAESERFRAHVEGQLAQTEKSRADLEARLKGVERDLVSLLRRVAGSPMGRFFTHKQEFRSLEERYLGTDA